MIAAIRVHWTATIRYKFDPLTYRPTVSLFYSVEAVWGRLKHLVRELRRRDIVARIHRDNWLKEASALRVKLKAL